jgi:hypothetical protein
MILHLLQILRTDARTFMTNSPTRDEVLIGRRSYSPGVSNGTGVASDHVPTQCHARAINLGITLPRIRANSVRLGSRGASGKNGSGSIAQQVLPWQQKKRFCHWPVQAKDRSQGERGGRIVSGVSLGVPSPGSSARGRADRHASGTAQVGTPRRGKMNTWSATQAPMINNGVSQSGMVGHPQPPKRPNCET